jgi:peptidylprolyl isomerase
MYVCVCASVVPVIKEGAGRAPQKGEKITVHCTGYLKDGMKKFWSTKVSGIQHRPLPAIEKRALLCVPTENASKSDARSFFGIFACVFPWLQDPGQKAFSFNVGIGQVVRGWDDGFMDMKEGEEARLEMTGDYAYGDKGFPAWGIGPNATLIFDVAIISIGQ